MHFVKERNCQIKSRGFIYHEYPSLDQQIKGTVIINTYLPTSDLNRN